MFADRSDVELWIVQQRRQVAVKEIPMGIRQISLHGLGHVGRILLDALVRVATGLIHLALMLIVVVAALKSESWGLQVSSDHVAD